MMKKNLSYFALAAALGLGSTSVFAEEEMYKGAWYALPGISYNWTDSDLRANDDVGGFIRAGKEISQNWDVQFGGSYASMDGNTDGKYKQTLLGVDALYMFSREKLRPFLLVGLGYAHNKIDSVALSGSKDSVMGNVGAGVQISGFDYGFKYRFGCANRIGGSCQDLNGVQDTLNATSTITSSTGATLYTRTYQFGANAPAPYSATFSSVDTQQRFSSSVPIENLGNFKISFTGQDNGYWGGNYGPTIKDIYSKAVYTVDPCVANPLSSPSCPGYNNIVTSPSIAAQTYAINQALNLSGAGVQINGFEYGYHYYVGDGWCRTSILGVCLNYDPSSMAVDVNVTSSTGASLYTATHNHTDQNTGGQPSYSYVFPAQRLLSSMGNFSLTTREVGSTALYSSWSRWQYTPDPCVVDPLSSTSCSGYAAAYMTQQCNANPLYNSACPGYAAAMFTQQCNANPLSDPACPGYASAYLNYQCSINPLYSTTCSGYEQAYHDQQCSISPLFASDCPGYAAAYKTQQCTADPLFATDCPGYDQAYLNSQCIRDSLYSRLCTGYATAYAIKNLIKFSDSSISSSVNQSLSDTAATKANDPANTVVSTTAASTTVSSDGTVSTGVSVTGDTNVDKAISSKTTSASGTAPAAPVQLNAPPPAAAKVEDKKPEGGGPGPQQAQNEPKGGDSKPAPTARQELQAKREAAAKAEAVEKGKNLANEMGKAADMESQKQIQNVVIQAMGFTPGFDTYSKAMMTDVVGYKPYSIYNNQKNIDNRANLRMFGGADRIHNEMVESQYNLKKED
jgi:hypothetical protein